ncbi:hypothetical protein KI387_006649, partial [Taxus chinensis]
TNVMGTLNMLGLAKRIGARFLLTSTSEVYGDPLQHPQTETYWGNVNPIGVRSCYDEGKRTAETLTMDYHRGANVEVRIARIFNTYGPRMCIDDGRVVSNFVAQALRKEPLSVYGNGKQTRSFQYVSDLVEGLIRLMESNHVGPFNLGNPGEFTMLELAEVVKETIDRRAQIEFKENTADDPHKRKPDIAKAKDLLKWEPKVSLREGLPLMPIINIYRGKFRVEVKIEAEVLVEPRDVAGAKNKGGFGWNWQTLHHSQTRSGQRLQGTCPSEGHVDVANQAGLVGVAEESTKEPTELHHLEGSLYPEANLTTFSPEKRELHIKEIFVNANEVEPRTPR